MSFIIRRFGQLDFRLRERWPVIAAIVVGLLLASAGGLKYKQFIEAHRETVRVVVAAREIKPYSVITEDDVKWAEVTKGLEDPAGVTDTKEAVGKLALTMMYEGEQVKKPRLGDPSLLKERRVVAVNVGVTQSLAGWARPGDLVDVWWIPQQTSLDTPGAGWTLAATDAVLLDLRDSAGRSVFSRGLLSAQSAPSIALLSVKKEDAGRVVGGAVPKSQNVALVAKYEKGDADEAQGSQITEGSNPGGAGNSAGAGNNRPAEGATQQGNP